MVQELTRDALPLVSALLETEVKLTGSVARFELRDPETKRRLALEINFDLNLVSVYAANTFLQLHNCTGVMVSDMLGQVTFFGKQNGLTSGLIVEKQAGCSLYANVPDELLNGDFTKLPPELMMGVVALSLTDTIDFEGFTFDE